MYPLYRDIKERLGKPVWYDRHGVPRYSEINPSDAAEIYCDCVVQLRVRCQDCGKVFNCVTAASKCNLNFSNPVTWFEEFQSDPLKHSAGWGDAPWHDADGDECGFESQCAGTTMRTDWNVVTWWLKENFDWVEKPVPPEYIHFDED